LAGSDSIVGGRVGRVEHYGLYVATERGAALVLVVDVGEVPLALKQVFHTGDAVRVRLERWIDGGGVWKASMRGLEQTSGC